jgi:hypothetical protein
MVHPPMVLHYKLHNRCIYMLIVIRIGPVARMIIGKLLGFVSFLEQASFPGVQRNNK